MAFLTTAKSKGAIDFFGGGEQKYKEVTEAGANVSSPDTPHSIGYIKESTFSDTTPMLPVPDETGYNVTTLPQIRTWKISGIMLQSGTAQYEFVDVVRDKFHQGYKYEGIKDGYHVEIFTGVGRFTPDFVIKHPDGTVGYEYEGLVAPSAITIAASDYGAYCGLGSLSATTVTVAAGTYGTKVYTPVS